VKGTNDGMHRIGRGRTVHCLHRRSKAKEDGLMPTRTERIAGGLLGLLVGDALGCPYEFHAAASIPARELIDMTPPPGFGRAHVGTPVGTWTDDGAQALCLLASLLDRGSFDPEDFGRRLVAWNDSGYLAVDGRVFDVGIQTGAALRRLRNGIPAIKAGSTEDNTLGNGSLRDANKTYSR
jgi:ADP-ribosylglycohydrolase